MKCFIKIFNYITYFWYWKILIEDYGCFSNSTVFFLEEEATNKNKKMICNLLWILRQTLYFFSCTYTVTSTYGFIYKNLTQAHLCSQIDLFLFIWRERLGREWKSRYKVHIDENSWTNHHNILPCKGKLYVQTKRCLRTKEKKSLNKISWFLVANNILIHHIKWDPRMVIIIVITHFQYNNTFCSDF